MASNTPMIDLYSGFGTPDSEFMFSPRQPQGMGVSPLLRQPQGQTGGSMNPLQMYNMASMFSGGNLPSLTSLMGGGTGGLFGGGAGAASAGAGGAAAGGASGAASGASGAMGGLGAGMAAAWPVAAIVGTGLATADPETFGNVPAVGPVGEGLNAVINKGWDKGWEEFFDTDMVADMVGLGPLYAFGGDESTEFLKPVSDFFKSIFGG